VRFLDNRPCSDILRIIEFFHRERKEVIIMKKTLSLLTGIAIVLALGLALAEDRTSNAGNRSDQMIRDDDLLRFNLDQDRATINQMPAGAGEQGSGAGGISAEPEGAPSGIDETNTPVEKGVTGPGEVGTGAGGASKVPERYQY
jgi:hypothetical protein